ncbi:MAG: hypothetical protein Aureis2KO_14780 [Aureisphaera sp.]
MFVTDKWILDEFYFYADGRDKDLDFWYQMAGLISMLFYLVLSLNSYKNYRKQVVEEVSYADAILFNWISHYMIAFSFILVLRVLFFVLNPEWGEFGSKYWYYLWFSILFFFIAIAGYSNTMRAAISYENNQPIKHDQGSSTIESSENDKKHMEEWKTKILSLIEEEQMYTDPNLTLTHVASYLNTNRNVISNVINTGFQMNFNDFINQKRVEVVIQKIEKGEHETSTLLGIALDCGFNSKTTFNRAFKKHTSLTPKQYIAKKVL